MEIKLKTVALTVTTPWRAQYLSDIFRNLFTYKVLDQNISPRKPCQLRQPDPGRGNLYQRLWSSILGSDGLPSQSLFYVGSSDLLWGRDQLPPTLRRVLGLHDPKSKIILVLCHYREKWKEFNDYSAMTIISFFIYFIRLDKNQMTWKWGY